MSHQHPAAFLKNFLFFKFFQVVGVTNLKMTDFLLGEGEIP
jgi:hypothetical protein